eukprot:6470294-Lingulodinium_polyedra.AAC.1
MARVLPPEVQAAVLRGDTRTRAWRTYVATLRCTLVEPTLFGNEDSAGVCYLAFSSASNVWYVGKASSVRERNR